MKKLKILVCSILMIVTLISTNVFGATYKLNVTKRTLYPKKTVTLKVKGVSADRVLFMSSNSKVAKVNKKSGKVVAVTPGAVKIYAKITNKSKKKVIKKLTCKITVKECVHNWSSEITKEPTCKKSGLKESKCLNCGQIQKEVLPIIDHDYKLVSTIEAATCIRKGKGTYKCNFCGKQKTDIIEKSEVHQWDEGVITKKATCAATGIKKYKCKNCTETKEDVIPMDTNAHVWDSGKVVKAATCKAKGSTMYTCTLCKKVRSEDIAITDHNWGTISASKEATCLLDGEGTQTCSVCKTTRKVTIPKVDHKYKVTAIPATCTEGNSSKYACQYCGYTYYVKGTSPALGHKYIATVKNPTLTMQGYTTHTCSVCKDSYTDTYTWYIPSESVASDPTGIRGSSALKPGVYWSANTSYTWKGGSGDSFDESATGETAFAYTCSDKMFGINQAYKVTGGTSVRPGDIAFANGKTYFVESVVDDVVYGATTITNTVVWDQPFNIADISYCLSRWYD